MAPCLAKGGIMSVRPERSVLLLVALFSVDHDDTHPEASSDGVEPRAGAFILSGSALDDGRGSLLSAMRGKVPNLRIHLSSSQCPQISLRSHVTFETVVEPHIYVDGTRATDTCILESLRSQDVELVEIYPMGFTTRPGYGTHAHGLILVFMRTE
jgi:hypothetical protein